MSDHEEILGYMRGALIQAEMQGALNALTYAMAFGADPDAVFLAVTAIMQRAYATAAGEFEDGPEKRRLAGFSELHPDVALGLIRAFMSNPANASAADLFRAVLAGRFIAAGEGLPDPE